MCISNDFMSMKNSGRGTARFYFLLLKFFVIIDIGQVSIIMNRMQIIKTDCLVIFFSL